MTTVSPTTPRPADAVAAALATHPGSTAVVLAEAAGIGRSTAGKCLATLEHEGRARRTPGGREDGRRQADRWTAVEADDPEGVTDDGSEPDEPAGEHATAEDDPGDDPREAGTDEDAGEDTAGAVAPGAPTDEADGADGAAPAGHADAGSNRLGKGALRTLVYDYLVAHAGGGPDGEGLSPTAIAKGLDRSSGAVGNSLIRLEEEGKVTLVRAAPRRYRPAGG